MRKSSRLGSSATTWRSKQLLTKVRSFILSFEEAQHREALLSKLKCGTGACLEGLKQWFSDEAPIRRLFCSCGEFSAGAPPQIVTGECTIRLPQKISTLPRHGASHLRRLFSAAQGPAGPCAHHCGLRFNNPSSTIAGFGRGPSIMWRRFVSVWRKSRLTPGI